VLTLAGSVPGEAGNSPTQFGQIVVAGRALRGI
jgi:hypothetical protein